jgi:hypothetical protein
MPLVPPSPRSRPKTVPVNPEHDDVGWEACRPGDRPSAYGPWHAGAFLAYGGQEIAVAGVGIAPAEVGVQGPALHSVVGIV